MKFIKKIVVALLITTIGINIWMILSTKKDVYKSIDGIPFNEVGLVLGTSNRYKDGSENNFFKERMLTAAQLYKSGKVNRLIVSGANNSQYYNEPEMMRTTLVDLGVPDNKITLDGEGIRTIESIKNCKYTYGLKNATIVTQEFHGYRALFICGFFGIDSQVMSTKKLPFSESANVRLREFFARIKAVGELYFFNEGADK